jgi:cobalamin biosynthesis protein CobT
VTQEDDCTVSFATKMWGKTKEFVAKIETQRPDERIKWRVSQGITHTGVVTFHELAPRLTRIELTMDVDPGSLIEKAARGMRHIKRAARADLHRFKAFIEMQELETGAWRGVIEDGELVEPHDDSYDEERDYSDIEDAMQQDEEEESSEDEEQHEGGNGGGQERTQRFKRQAERTRGGGQRAAAKSGGSSATTRSASRGASSRKGSGSSGSSSSGRSSSASSRSGKSGSASRRKTTSGS